MESHSLPDRKASPLRCPRHALRLWAWRTLGTVSVGIGCINLFIPLLPASGCGAGRNRRRTECRRNQSTRAPDSATTLRHFSISSRIRSANAAGVPPATSPPVATIRRCSSRLPSAVFTSALIR